MKEKTIPEQVADKILNDEFWPHVSRRAVSYAIIIREVTAALDKVQKQTERLTAVEKVITDFKAEVDSIDAYAGTPQNTWENLARRTYNSLKELPP